jgi:hypothetical protein
MSVATLGLGSPGSDEARSLKRLGLRAKTFEILGDLHLHLFIRNGHKATSLIGSLGFSMEDAGWIQ